MRAKILVAGLGLLMTTAPAFAVDRDFDLTNRTGYDIKAVFLDESASPVWTDNSIESVMTDGETVRMKFGRGDIGCKWDMKVVFTDDSSAIWHGFNLCEINSIRLRYNKNTDVTTADVE